MNLVFGWLILDKSIQHPWDLTAEEAVALQEQLRRKVIIEDQLGTINLIAGVDVGYDKNLNLARAAVVVLHYPDLELEERAVIHYPANFPYVPGLLSFREVPAMLKAINALRIRPDLMLCDGHGLAHPRRFGLACHIGVLKDIPSIGVAKRRLIGEHDQVSDERGTWQPLRHDDEIIGAVLRTRSSVRPVYISIGHRISLKSAISYVLGSTTRYRLPEPTRMAHNLASRK
jgi:deoxyribonuclease V